MAATRYISNNIDASTYTPPLRITVTHEEEPRIRLTIDMVFNDTTTFTFLWVKGYLFVELVLFGREIFKIEKGK